MSVKNITENPYLYRLPKVMMLQGRMDFVVDRCQGKKILHLGCVDEGLTEERLREKKLLHNKLISTAREVWGVDLNASGINLLRENGVSNLIVGNIEEIDKIEELGKHHFDIIVVTEVIEHLNNPGLFLQNVKTLFASDTKMIVTVPNGLRLTGLMHQMRGYESVHPDHNYWFSYKTLETLLKKNSYQIDEMFTYSFYHRFKFKKLNRLPGFLLRRFIQRRNVFFASDGIIVVVRPALGS
jgi:2-polyprenyl-3-methyl-5-hydroxy-6-metoxy-1,4-benzoquinol methylase